jgi:hypothetical protein
VNAINYINMREARRLLSEGWTLCEHRDAKLKIHDYLLKAPGKPYLGYVRFINKKIYDELKKQW